MKPIPRYFVILFLMLFSGAAYAQQGKIQGLLRDKNSRALELAAVVIKGTTVGTTSDEKGFFELEIPANQRVWIVVQHMEYDLYEFIAEVTPNEVKTVMIPVFVSRVNTLHEVEIKGEKPEEIKIREQASTVSLDPKTFKVIPTPFGDFNQGLVAGGGLGITSNNELSSNYSVRGGNFDENLIYVNNIQVYRPFLVKAGQQEGLSFVNPDMVKSVEFSSGGWQPKYADKLSSVLNVQYKEPEKFGGTLTLGLLNNGLHLEGATKNKRLKYVLGGRYKNSKYILGTLESKGQYLPRFFDFQSYITYDLNPKKPGNTTLNFLGSYAQNRYFVQPENRQTDFGSFQQTLRFTVYFDGHELMNYDTFQGGLRLNHKFNSKISSSLIVSGVSSREREYVNVESYYRICDVNKDINSDNFNKCFVERGVGSIFNYSRNRLGAQIFSAENRNSIVINAKNSVDFGLRFDNEQIQDVLNEYAFVDSADYVNKVTDYRFTENQTSSSRLVAYWQHSIYPDSIQSITYGMRINYWSLNGEALISPRIQYSIAPKWKRDVVLNASLGIYSQPPFYRELRDFSGVVNKNVEAQKSLHAIGGLNWNMKIAERPFKLIAEGYFKKMWDVIPYDVDNVRLRYYATNDAKAYITGFDVRLNGELVQGTDSWVSVGVLSAKEDVGFDNNGYVRRPTDQRLNVGMYLEDKLPNNPTFRFHLRFLYGTGLPFGPPNNVNFRTAYKGNTYQRVDIGFSKLLTLREGLDDKNSRTIWIGLDVLNAFGFENRISYLWVKDYSDQVYPVPNALSQRFFNLKLIAKF